MKYNIEKSNGKVKMSKLNILVDDVSDMQELEYWEERLERLDEPYIIAYRSKEDKVVYTIFCNMKKKGSTFRY